MFFWNYSAYRCFDSGVSKLYHSRLMSGRATIDGFRFAREGQSLHGKIRLFDLPRLRESLSNAELEAHYRLEGGTDEHGRSVLSLSVTAVLPLVCQRCLHSVAVTVSPSTRFVLVATESELPPVEEEPPEWTAVVASPAMDVEALVEDELILALPIAPAHPDGECRPAQRADGAGGIESPFSALSALARKRF